MTRYLVKTVSRKVTAQLQEYPEVGDSWKEKNNGIIQPLHLSNALKHGSYIRTLY